jgi:AhpD family alkylhydroperoxidase
MNPNPFRAAMRRTALAQIQHVAPVDFRAAGPGVARVYGEMERDFGVLAPPIALHSAAPDLLAAVWLTLRETLVADGLALRAVKEAAASAVSLANACPYCVTVHSATVNSLVRGHDAEAIAQDRFDAVTDPGLRAVAVWARETATRDTAEGFVPPFPVEQAPELIGVAVVFHYLNRMVNVFLPDAPAPDGVPGFVLPVVARGLGMLTKRASRRPTAAGTSADLLPDAALPDDLAWAAGNPAVADAFARASSTVLRARKESVPASVAELLPGLLAGWDGRPKGLSPAWVDAAVAELPAADVPAGRVALLTAFASWQMDQRALDAYRAAEGTDRALIQLAGWASFTAARRIGAWIPATSRAAEASRLHDAHLRSEPGNP